MSEARPISGTQKTSAIVGHYIRKKREALRLSQRALGQLFEPPVTTQFVSNVERGVTPLPPNHVTTVAKALQIDETELLSLLEREYAAKLGEKIGRSSTPFDPAISASTPLTLEGADARFMQSVFEAYRDADPATRAGFETVIESMFGLKAK